MINPIFKKFLFLAVFSQASVTLFAQSVKTGVLVVGSNAAGVAAAIQSARSGAKTILLADGPSLGPDLTSSSESFKGGIYGEFIKHVRTLKKDTLALTDPATTAEVLRKLTDTVKNLTIRYGTSWEKVEKSGKGWEVKLAEKKGTIKATAVIDATLKEVLASSAGSYTDAKTKLRKTIVPPLAISDPYANMLYRTTLSCGIDAKTGAPYLVPAGAFIASGIDNFFVVGKLASSMLSSDALYAGQAVGALASYQAFFNASTSSLDVEQPVRKIQAELQLHGSWIFPFTDIRRSDPDFRLIEHIGLTGILKGHRKGSEFLFDADSSVSGEEVRGPLKNYYSRSQIWFSDHPDIRKFTLADMLSLIKYLRMRGNELEKEVEKSWKPTFLFKGDYDPQHVLTRREFAVLTEFLIKPFDVRVRITGDIGN